MTDVAAGMVRPFGQKDRLDAAFEKFVVKFRRSSRRGDCGGDRQRGQNRHAYERTSRHSTLHQRRRRSSSDGTSNANLDKLVPDKKRRIWRCTACPRRQLVDVAVGSIAQLWSWAGRFRSISINGHSSEEDPFGNGGGQMLALAKKEATAGPPLPFGPRV